MDEQAKQLQLILGDENLSFNRPLKNYSTIGIGGPARYLYVANTKKNLIDAVKQAIKQKIPYNILGSGSNTLISDSGFPGMVIINLTHGIKILPNSRFTGNSQKKLTAQPRLEQPDKDKFFSFADLDYDESDAPSVFVQLDSGVKLTEAIYKLISRGITGLQWFAGIPGTIGGAMFTNMHGGTKFIGNYVVSVNLLTQAGKTREENRDYLKFDYDYSYLHQSREIVLSVVLELKKGDSQKALKIAHEWAKRKSLQPQRSLGSTFQNISPQLRDQLGLPTTSTGYIIDKILGFRGTKLSGDAIVSLRSANFIENWGEAKASDVYKLIRDVKTAAKKKLGIDLVEEIQYLGDFPNAT